MRVAAVGEKGTFELRIRASSVDEAQRLARDAAGLINPNSLSDEELPELVRERARRRGLVVNVEPFASEGTTAEEDAIEEAA